MTTPLSAGRGSLIVGPFDVLDPTSPVLLSSNTSTLADISTPGPPDTATVERLLTDGEVVTGVRSANRTLLLPLVVIGTRTSRANAVARLAQVVNQPYWQITWTPDPASSPVVFDCFRGSLVQGTSPDQVPALLMAQQGVTLLTASIPALPFTRDATPTVFAPPPPGVGPATLDALSSVTGLSGAPQYAFADPQDGSLAQQDYNPSAGQTYGLSSVGPNPCPASTLAADTFAPPGFAASVKQTATGLQEQYTSQYEYQQGGIVRVGYAYYFINDFYYRWARALTTTNLTGIAQLAVYAATDLTMRGYDTTGQYSAGKWGGGSDIRSAMSGDWRLTLYSAGGWVAFTINEPMGSTNATPDKTWRQLVFPITGTPVGSSGTFDLTQVTSYKVEHWEHASNPNEGSASVWLADLQSIQSDGGVQLSGPYGLTTFNGVGGSARTPVSLAVSATGGTALSALLLARTPSPPVGFNPILSSRASTGGSSSSLSGAFMGSVYSQCTWTRPALSLSGTYAVLARVYNSGASAATVTVTGQNTGDTASTQTASRAFAAADPNAPPNGTFGWITVGTLTLPPRGVASANSAGTITLAYSATASLWVDIAVLVDLAGEAVFVQLPSGYTCSQVFLDAPGPTDMQGTVYGGTLADRSDAVDLTQWTTGMLTNFDPGQNALTVVADNATTGVTAQATYYRRWPGEAGSS